MFDCLKICCRHNGELRSAILPEDPTAITYIPGKYVFSKTGLYVFDSFENAWEMWRWLERKKSRYEMWTALADNPILKSMHRFPKGSLLFERVKLITRIEISPVRS